MSKPYSYHIFLFPFRWDFCEKDCINQDFSKRTQLKKFQDLLIPDKEKTDWKTEEYKTNISLNYNEYTYFYDFVRDAIFDTDENKSHEKKIMNHYAYNTNDKNYKYEISILDGKTYKLDIKEIYLHVYTTGVALLSYHLENNETSKFEDILKINEYGRRIYPHFLSKRFLISQKKASDLFIGEYLIAVKEKLFSTFFESKKDTVEKFKKVLDKNLENNFIINEFITTAQSSGLAESIKFKDQENFSYFNNPENIKNNVFSLPKFIQSVLGNNFVSENENKKITIKPLIDDRMFVISWYGDDILINKLNKNENVHENHYINKHYKGKTITGNKYNYLTNIDWYKYLFIDGKDAMCQNADMLEALNKKHTYARFIDWGTLFGISRYSFVCISPNFIMVHVKTIYYQIIVLSLMQRASILRFSEEVKVISKLDDDDKQLEKIKQINKAYLIFINTMYFREVTAQEQGIELYDMIQEHMRIERDVKDLNREIDELYQFARLLEDEKESKETNKHTWLATFFLPAMLISGILGMNIWDKSDEIPQFLIGGKFVLSFWIPTIIVLILTIFFTKTHIIIWNWLKTNLKKQ